MDDDKTEDLDSTETVRPASQDLPQRVGPYRILELLGEGGMGVDLPQSGGHGLGACATDSDSRPYTQWRYGHRSCSPRDSS